MFLYYTRRLDFNEETGKVIVTTQFYGKVHFVNYFCPTLSLQAENGLGQKCEPNPKCFDILEMCQFVTNIKKAIAQKCAMAFLAPATGIGLA